MKKQCSKCRKTKEMNSFNKRKDKRRKKSFYRSECKKCQQKYDKLYRIKNKIKIKKYLKENRERLLEQAKLQYHKNKNLIKIKEKSQKWRDNNRERFNELNRKSKQKYRNTVRGRLDLNFSGGIRESLKGKKAGRKWETLVGYTLQDLIQHLEKQFDGKMNWNNYSFYWHIDHIVPQSWFPYQTAEEQAFRDCWALENLQPLEAKANTAKRDRFISFYPTQGVFIIK